MAIFSCIHFTFGYCVRVRRDVRRRFGILALPNSILNCIAWQLKTNYRCDRSLLPPQNHRSTYAVLVPVRSL
ncbi:hypothetical protein H6F77_16755 [Microcoleus sp. FACHB-831]|uniref:hypothetical protein n=1 Tax=Microcoleus sp. FACHB-831 TaxID=2692827 RepID=UPI001682F379|nr:hypothetical protein [Microcoleus sp. FACHB-831]MBD1922708.1 hypothetical protein [Microcoleus sp. FACHB-831]